MRLKIDVSCLPKKIDEYFDEFLKSRPEVVADIESLAAFLGVTREELVLLESHKKVGRAVLLAKTKIASEKKQLCYKGKLNATLLAFDLKNDHGYREKSEENKNITVLKGSVLEWGD